MHDKPQDSVDRYEVYATERDRQVANTLHDQKQFVALMWVIIVSCAVLGFAIGFATGGWILVGK